MTDDLTYQEAYDRVLGDARWPLSTHGDATWYVMRCRACETAWRIIADRVGEQHRRVHLCLPDELLAVCSGCGQHVSGGLLLPTPPLRWRQSLRLEQAMQTLSDRAHESDDRRLDELARGFDRIIDQIEAVAQSCNSVLDDEAEGVESRRMWDDLTAAGQRLVDEIAAARVHARPSRP